LQYYARRFYNDLLISPTMHDDNLQFYVVSDRVKPVPAKIKVTLTSFDGAALKTLERDVTIAPIASRSYFDVKVSELLKGTDKKKAFVYAELLVNGKAASSHDYFFAPFKELAITKPAITTEVVGAKERGKFVIKVSADKFAKAVYLAVPDHDGFFSDNFFNLAPGREMTVQFRSRAPISLDEFRKRLQVRSVFDAF
jgi:beta-mannosidase